MSQPYAVAPELDPEMEEVIAELEAFMEAAITEDETPVDNIFSAKQQRLLTDPLYSAWPGLPDEQGQPRQFLACANVGLYWSVHKPAIVPDFFLSLDVATPTDWWRKRNRAYFTWEFGKVPDVVVEIVSNRVGNETGSKLRDYALIGIRYYIVHDPGFFLGDEELRIFELQANRYVRRHDTTLPDLGLGVTLWEGSFENVARTRWLRWCDLAGNLIPTGAELAQQALAQVERENARAEQEAARAEQEAAKNARLAAKLRELGLDPDTL